MKKRNLLLFALLSGCIAFNGCSVSESSKSISKSITSPSKSSNSKGKESAEKTADSYTTEVETLAILYVGSHGTTLDFQREMDQISNGHGIADWENVPETFKAIGIGLKRAKVAEDSISSLPFLQSQLTSAYYPQILAAYK